MTERWRTLLYALVALGLLVLLFVQTAPRDDGYRPLTVETNVSGLAGLQRWLVQTGLVVTALNEDWESLPEDTGSVMLIHSPVRRQIFHAEWEAIRHWVQAGNRLVVADFSNEEFAPSRVSSLRALEQRAPTLLLEDTAWEEPSPVLDDARLLSPFAEVPLWVRALGGLEVRVLEAASAHPLVAGVTRVEVISDLHGHRWRQNTDDGFPWLPLLKDQASGSEVAWVRSFGEGEIVAFLHPSLFANGALGQADNARLALNLLTPSSAGGQLLIDDYHQIEATPDAGDQLLTDLRLYMTLAILILFWLLWLIADDGAWERRVSVLMAPERRRIDLARAIGSFLARHMDQQTAAERLIAPVRTRLAERHGVSEEEAFTKLAEEPGMNAALVQNWGKMVDQIRNGRWVALTKVRMMALNMLEQLT